MALSKIGKIIEKAIEINESKIRQKKIDSVLIAYHLHTGKKVDLDINPFLHELLKMK